MKTSTAKSYSAEPYSKEEFGTSAMSTSKVFANTGSDREGQSLSVAEYIERFKKPGERENANYGVVFHTLRHISFYLSIPLVHTRITPNQITIFTHFVQLIAVSIVAFAPGYYRLWGVFLFFLGGIVDFIDGNIARFRNCCSTKGVFYDQIGHVLLAPVYFVAVAIAAYHDTQDVDYLFWAIGIAIFASLMCFQVAVSPKYFDSTGEQAGESVAADINDENDATSPSQKGVVYLMRKVVASFYHYKMELLAVFILLDQLPALAVISGIYFFVRFFIQLYLDQRAITS